MKKLIALLAGVACLAMPVQADTSMNGAHFTNVSCTVYFSPNGGAQQAVLAAINGAKNNIRMAQYEITVKAIADALIAAKQRGVDVRIIVDKGESKQAYSYAQYLANAGVDIAYDTTVTLHHNKWTTVDGFVLLTGSYNLSASAETKNAENMLDCHSTAGSAVFNQYWNEIKPRTVTILPVAAMPMPTLEPAHGGERGR